MSRQRSQKESIHGKVGVFEGNVKGKKRLEKSVNESTNDKSQYVFTCCGSKDSPRDPWWYDASAAYRIGRVAAADDGDEGGVAAGPR